MIVVHSSLTLLLALCSRTDIGGAVRPRILKLERTRRWAAERAAVNAKLSGPRRQLICSASRAQSLARHALEAEIEAVEKNGASKPELRFEQVALKVTSAISR